MPDSSAPPPPPPPRPHPPFNRPAQLVEDIQLEGGTVLGTSEDGSCDPLEVVKCLDL